MAPISIQPKNGIPNGRSSSITEQIQIINEEKKFKLVLISPFLFCLLTYNLYSPNLNDQIKNWGLYDAGFAYNIVAVFGSQSTGKSALFTIGQTMLVYSLEIEVDDGLQAHF